MLTPTHTPMWGLQPVQYWLGLGPMAPEGMHGPQRRRIVRRHTRFMPGEGSKVGEALVKAYHRNREAPILMLLRRRDLDDDLWRAIYALMVQGGPINLYDLVAFLQAITSDDEKIALAEAERRMAYWYRMHAIAAAADE